MSETSSDEINKNLQNQQSIVEKTADNLNNKYANIIGSKYYVIIYAIGIYIIIHFAISTIFSSNEMTEQYISNSVDILLFLFAMGYFLYNIIELPEDERKYIFSGILLNYGNFISDPMNAINIAIFVIVSFFLFKFASVIPFLGLKKPIFISILEFFLTITLLLIGIQYLTLQIFNVDLVAKIRKMINSVPDVLNLDSTNEKSNKPNKPNIEQKEVFHISNNLYTYEDAKGICKAFDAELATYEQIEDAYKNGGEWCEYGWSDNQMAFFPTQKDTWDKLQKNPKTKNNCGRIGVNGGYFSNPNLRFGVNCYGIKPKATDENYAKMNSQINIPKTPDEKKLEEQTNFWKKYKDELILTSSFNQQKWSQHQSVLLTPTQNT